MISKMGNLLYSEILVTNIVDFGKADDKPSCTCQHWTNTNFPCKHFFLIFQYREKWNWDSLPQQYLSSPYLSADVSSLTESSIGMPGVQNEIECISAEDDVQHEEFGSLSESELSLSKEGVLKPSELSTRVSDLGDLTNYLSSPMHVLEVSTEEETSTEDTYFS